MAGEKAEQQVALNTLPFWSNFVLGADLRWSPSFLDGRRQVVSAGMKRKVFAYKDGDTDVQALEGRTSTERDTLLTEGGKTRGGALYKIYGISVTPDGLPYTDRGDQKGQEAPNDDAMMPSTETAANGALLVPTVEDERGLTATLVNLLLANFHLMLKVDGTKRLIPFGPVGLYPGIGHLDSTVNAKNGLPYNQNFMQIPEGITWNPAGASDSNMIVVIGAEYNVWLPTWTTFDGIDPETGLPYVLPPGQSVKRSPLGRKWKQRWILNFHGEEIGPLSQVS